MNRTFQYAAISLFLGLMCYLFWYYLITGADGVSDNNTSSSQTNTMQVRKPNEHLLGAKLFKANCASCHKLNAKLIGPALADVEQRWTEAGEYNGVSGREWLKRYIRNWQDPVNAGYPYAIEIINYDMSAMTQFPQLSMDDIDSILLYIDAPKPQSIPVVVVD